MPGMPAGFASGPPPGGSISPSQLASQAAYTVLGNPTAAPASPIATTDPVVSGSSTAARFLASANNTAAAPSVLIEPAGNSGLYWDATKGVVASVDAVDRLMLRVNGTTEISSGTNNAVPALRVTNTLGDVGMYVSATSPEGFVVASIGDYCFDQANGRFYLKVTGTGTGTGWREISPSQSGTYTPHASVVTNLDSVTPNVSHYVRVGDEVSFSASGTFDPTAAAPTNFGLSLPIASNFAATQDAEGVGVSQVYAPGFVQADITNDRLDVYFTTSGTASIKWTVTGTYRVL